MTNMGLFLVKIPSQENLAATNTGVSRIVSGFHQVVWNFSISQHIDHLQVREPAVHSSVPRISGQGEPPGNQAQYRFYKRERFSLAYYYRTPRAKNSGRNRSTSLAIPLPCDRTRHHRHRRFEPGISSHRHRRPSYYQRSLPC